MASADTALDRQAPVLVRTKLHPPRLRPGHVPRPALVARLRAGADRRVTLVRAPAGAGKTSLLAEWLAEWPAVAWVSLDAGDDDPARFWAYVLEALRGAGAAVPAELADALAAPRTRPEDLVLPELINALAAGAGRTVLVLDDLQLVTAPEVHTGLAFLLERAPPSLHLCLASRAEPPPPLPIARLRARGELAELDAADLRLDPDEAGRLVAAVTGTPMAAEDVVRAHARTEGWAAGLQLLAVSLRGRRPGEVGGDDRHLADWLTAEVLDGLEPGLRDRLLRSAILDRLSGPLADEVLGTEGCAVDLERLERRGLPLVALDHRGAWYRWHALFADLLRRRLEQEVPADDVRELHRRAAGWWRREGDVAEAVRHLAAAGDRPALGELVAGEWIGALQRGQLATARAWLDLVGEEAERRGDLLLARAWVSLDAGQPDAAARAVAAAEAVQDGDRAVPPAAAMTRATLAYIRGDLGAAVHAARRALALAEDEWAWLAVARATLGSSLLWAGGASDEVAAALTGAIDRAVPGRNTLAVLRAFAALGLLRAEAGEREAARTLLGHAREARDGNGLAEFPWAGLASALEGRLLEDEARLDEAAAAFARAAVLARRGRVAPERAFALVRLARVRRALGDGAGTAAALREARRVVAACPDPGTLGHALAAAERGGAPAQGGGDELTERELTVLRALAGSLPQPELASALYVSVNTLKTHVRTIYRKLGVRSREEAVARARERGLL